MQNIQLGGMTRNPDVNKYPYTASFIPNPYQNNQLPPIGESIPPGGAHTFLVRLPRDDSVFHMLYVKYTAYYESQGTYYLHHPGPAGDWKEYWTHAASGTWQINNTFYWRTFAEYLNVKLSEGSGPERIIYGDRLRVSPDNNQVNTKLRAQAIQAQFSGYRVIRTSHLFAKEGVVEITVENKHNIKTLLVNGSIFGYRIYV